MKKTAQLRRLLQSPTLEFLMEAHNGLSARIVEEAGFKGIWGSGLSISASQAVRDNNELSWTEVLDIVEFMSDATTIPILLDGDTGYGNFNNMRRLVKKLEERNVAGVCIEDKLFPKTNSFLRSTQQPLADMEEFCGKIKAGKDSQGDDDFCVVARVEAFIAGWGLQEALKRASAYQEAGADAILIHSKLSKPDEILAFMKQWGNRCPVVIVPTKYYTTPSQVFRDHGISVVIWANHMMRSAVTAMQKTASKVHDAESLLEVEDKVASLVEVFRLQRDEELQEAEKIYLREKEHERIHAIILAASRGSELREMTRDIPKSMIKVNGKTLLEKMLGMLQDRGIRDISVIRGYKKEAIQFPNVTYFDNDKYENTNELSSLLLAKNKIEGTCIVSYGDIIYRKHVLGNLLDEESDIVIVVDALTERRQILRKSDFVHCSRPYTRSYDEEAAYLKQVRFLEILNGEKFDGEWIGLMKTTARGSEAVRAALEKLSQKSEFCRLNMSDLLNELLATGVQIRVLYIEGHWLDVDTLEDIGKTTAYSS
ncbi:MAG: phosphoenolpyruvate mutase [Ignavibacteriales bacterium]|nr:phosphoenolpyruvate mutase [Ignavibacteriales bacterium]